MLLYCITLSSSRENQRSAQEVACGRAWAAASTTERRLARAQERNQGELEDDGYRVVGQQQAR